MNFWNFLGLPSINDVKALNNNVELLNANIETLSANVAKSSELISLYEKTEQINIEHKHLSSQQLNELASLIKSCETSVLEDNTNSNREVIEKIKALVKNISTKQSITELSSAISIHRNDNSSSFDKITTELDDVIVLLKALVVQDISKEVNKISTKI